MNNNNNIKPDANIPLKRQLFLLGGHDLEMQTIAELLNENDCNFVDRNLHWDNARLSAYTDMLSYNGTIYGVELYDDIPPWKNYIRIDHHNDFISKKSSLEQVADVIGVKLNHYQRLVAANDAQYIPGMIELGATKSEINEIRKADRQAQGVTQEDERLAADAIKNNLQNIDGITIVKSETHRFSTICDRLYPYKKLLIYSDSELAYYGENARKLDNFYTEEIKNGKAFKGGSENGFFGLANGYYSKDEILQNVEKIKNIVK